MPLRWRIILLLLPLTAASFWIIHLLEGDGTDRPAAGAAPDYTMSGLESLSMNEQGQPDTRLSADFMAHYESKQETALTRPRLEIFRPGRQPLRVSADRGWVTSGNEVILLRGDVRFWENDAAGEPKMEITTSQARVFPEREYAETDEPATLSTPRTRTESVGMKAYLESGRIVMLNDVHTTITEGTLLKSGNQP